MTIEERNKLVIENKGLVGKTMSNLNMFWENQEEYEDIFQIGLMGLIYSLNKYNKEISKVGNYCYNGIANYLKQYIMYKNRKKFTLCKETSLDRILGEDLEIRETIKDVNIDVEEEVIKKSIVNEIIEIINTKLSDKHAKVIKMYFGIDGYEKHKHKEIAKKLNFSYQYSSEALAESIKAIKQEMKKRGYDINE